MIYNIRVHTDMGNMLIKPENMPEYIRRFVYEKINMYVETANDNKGYGCLFHLLKPGLNKNWAYMCGADTVNILWDLDEWNSNTMQNRQNIRNYGGKRLLMCRG